MGGESRTVVLGVFPRQFKTGIAAVQVSRRELFPGEVARGEAGARVVDIRLLEVKPWEPGHPAGVAQEIAEEAWNISAWQNEAAIALLWPGVGSRLSDAAALTMYGALATFMEANGRKVIPTGMADARRAVAGPGVASHSDVVKRAGHLFFGFGKGAARLSASEPMRKHRDPESQYVQSIAVGIAIAGARALFQEEKRGLASAGAS